MNQSEFQEMFSEITNFRKNRFHPLVWINGEPEIGSNVYIGGMSEINCKGAKVTIGDNCDIASFVSINCADSHKKSIGLADEVERKNITIEENVFIGSHSVVKGGAHIGHHSVIAAGTIVDGITIPPYSLITGNPMQIKEGYYAHTETRDIPHNKPTIDSQEEKAALRVLRSGWVAQNGEVEHLENEFCSVLGLPEGYAVAVSSGTAALFLALWSLEAKNKRVALPVYVCSALRHAIAMAGGVEVLLDIKQDTPNIAVNELLQSEANLAIIPHMFGLPVDLQDIRTQMPIIEDCAQALGARVKGIPVGLQGNIGIYSFYATKLITSGGQGGMVVSKDEAIIRTVRDFRQFDQRRDNKVRFNFQMTDLQAAIAREQLKKLPRFLDRREKIFQKYRYAGLNLLDISQQEYQQLSPVRYRAVLHTKHYKKVMEHLRELGIKTIVPIEDWELLGSPELYPRAQKLSQETLSIPLYPSLSDQNVDLIIRGVLDS